MTCERNRIGEDELQLIDFSEEDDYLIAFPLRDSLEDLRLSVTYENLNECDRIKVFESINSQVLDRIDQAQSESMDTRRQSFLRKSLAWDNAFFTSAGVLNVEELFMINKGFKNGESNNPSSLKTPKHIPPPHRITPQKTNICPQNKVCKQANKASDSGQMKNKTRKAGLGGPELSVCKRSKSTCFASPTNQKLDCSYESASSTSSSKSFTRRINPTNTKASATCTSIDRWLSSSSKTNNTLSSSEPKRKSKSCGLRMPSPKIGFFDEISPVTRGRCSKVGVSFSKLKADGQVRMKMEEQKRRKHGTSFQTEDMREDESDQKENVCSFENQVNGLTRFFEVVHLDGDVGPQLKPRLSLRSSTTPLAAKQ